MRSYFSWILSAAAIIVMISGCGKGNPPAPLPVPAPAPVSPTPGGYIPQGGSCGAVGGSVGGQGPQTFSARLNGSPGSYVQVTVAPQQYGTLFQQSTQVTGSVAVFLADQQPMSYPGQVQQTQQTPICAQTQASASQVNVFSAYDNSVAMVLYGTAQLPAYTQYSPYPTGQYSQSSVTVYIGYGCSGYLDIQNQKFIGCVGIQYGNQGQISWYTTY